MRKARIQAITATPSRETVPAFGDVLVDVNGGVWIQDYPRQRDEARRWTVLDRAGVPRARIETPKGLEIYEVGNGYLLGRQKDELGIERITSHRLERG